MRFIETIGISYHIRKIEHEVRQNIDMVLKPLNLTLPKYSALSILEDKKKMTNAQLARECSVAPQTMIRILQSLEEDSFVTKKEYEKKTNSKIIYEITSRAIKVICKAHLRVNEIELKMIEGLSKKEVSIFNHLVEKMLINLKK